MVKAARCCRNCRHRLLFKQTFQHERYTMAIKGVQVITEAGSTAGFTVEFVDDLGTIVSVRFSGRDGGINRTNAVQQAQDYLAGTSCAETSAYDTFTRRAGVCRDFAHLGITFCRALGIPARFVSGYCWKLKPADFHAVFEAYLGGRWYLFDATRMCPLNGLVRIGVGRDAADTAFATYYGEIEDAPKLVWIERRDLPAVDGVRSPDWAISTAAL